ncbi:MAG: glycosyltransferase family 2 protein [Epsilonproteobacteria bacterium]|nr:glycosyltransferase family 2 protein [Campylobacterota bacterium]
MSLNFIGILSPMNPGLVSVIIPTKDRLELLHRAVHSVLQQTYQNIEIIIVDDGSNQPFSMEIDDPRIKLLVNPVSLGGAAARNIGLQAARGEFICLLDDDDYYLPSKIEAQLFFLKKNPDIDLVFSKVDLLKENSTEVLTVIEDGYSFNVIDNFFRWNVIHTNSSLFKNKVIKQVQFDERLKKYQDMQFYLEISLKFIIDYLPKTVAVWNVDGDRKQITSKKSVNDFNKEYVNFSLICEKFNHVLEQDVKLKNQYIRRLSFTAIRANKYREAFHLLKRHQIKFIVIYLVFFVVLEKIPIILKLRYKLMWMLNRVN